ncbi:hypothetical protein HD554DRAFT_641453 [Boletus coccyginus]|nr:hypothetical protein HD554DRAFT_641453 [Boletus coccyginus]
MFTSYECEFCRTLGLMCEYHLIPATPFPSADEDHEGSSATEGYDSDPEFEEIIQALEVSHFSAADQMYWIGNRAEAGLPGTTLADTSAKELASSPTTTKSAKPPCPLEVCRWRDDASGICGDILSCHSVPTHFKVVHKIRNMNELKNVECRWEGCFMDGGRKNFARHIRESHLGHTRYKGHSS